MNIFTSESPTQGNLLLHLCIVNFYVTTVWSKIYILITNSRRKDGIETPQMEVEGAMVPSIQLGTPHVATIMILDDDHGGVFQFENHEAEIVESVGVFELLVARMSGARGKVAIPYTTEEGTAKAGKDYEHQEGELIYENEENK